MMSDEQFAALMKSIDEMRGDIAKILAGLNRPIRTEVRGGDLILAVRRAEKKRDKPDAA